MSDLLIMINAPASKKNGFVVLETYYTRSVGVNKSGKYKGGSISAANVLNCQMIGNADHNQVKKLFSELCYPLGENSFHISVENLKKLHGEFQENKLFFINNTDRSLCIINTISETPLRRKNKYQYLVNNYYLSYGGQCTLFVENTNRSPYVIRELQPTPRLFFDKKTQVYSLCFDYCGIKIPHMDKKLSVMVDGAIILRNYYFEIETGEKLIREHFIKLAQCRYAYSGHNSKQHLNNSLSQRGIILEDDDNVIIPQIKVQRTDSDWFEIDLLCDINGDVIDLASRINLFASKDKIEVDGKQVILPDSIIDAKDEIILDGNKIKIRQNNIFHLLHIVYDSGKLPSDFFSFSDIELYLPQQTICTAYPYQIHGIRWLKYLYLNHIGGCLADDMGLGKTFQIISFLGDREVRSKTKKTIVIVPKSLLTNWKKEFEKFSVGFRVGIYHGSDRVSFDFAKTDVIITTYNTAHLDLDTLNQFDFSLAVFDEIQIIKNYKSVMSESMKHLNAKVKIGLSGTPMENSISELWNVMDVLNPDVFSSHSAFMKRYNGRNYDELRTIISFFIMRRMKKDVLKELPPKTEQIIYCDMDLNQRRLYTSITVAVKQAIMNLKAFAAPVVLKGLTELRECCCHPLLLDDAINVDAIRDSCKMESLSILVENLFESGHKILIFSNYTSMLQIIKNHFYSNKAYRDYLFYLDGKTKNRNELVEQFEQSDKGIFLISIKAGGIGLNLVSAQDVIIYDPWWNPFVEQQAIDRAYRIGQEKAVTIYKLVVANTLEEKIIDMQRGKEQDFDQIINGISSDKNMDINMILSLL